MKEDWVECIYEDLLTYEQPTNYIVESTNYHESFKTPVLTAGKSFILGYTNETFGIYKNLPVIIFDDFTTSSQFVEFEFKVKSSAMKILCPISKSVNLKFVFLSLQANKVRSDTHKRYWISIIAKNRLQLPPNPIQRAILNKIDFLFSGIDKGISDLKTAQQQLKIYRQAVLKKAFEGRLTNKDLKEGELPEGWEWEKLAEIVAELSQGWSPKCINKNSIDFNEWAVIKTSAIQHGKFIESENKILPLNLVPKEQHEIKVGDILITRAGPRQRVGVCCLVRKSRPKLINCDKVYKLRLKKSANLEFFMYQINSTEFISKIEEIKTGGNDSGVNLTQKRLLSLEFILPPTLAEQQSIVREIESRLSVCDKIEQSISEALEKAEALRQSILKKAFDGRLLSEEEIAACKREPDYEPAAMLLERIKKEKHGK